MFEKLQTGESPYGCTNVSPEIHIQFPFYEIIFLAPIWKALIRKTDAPIWLCNMRKTTIIMKMK